VAILARGWIFTSGVSSWYEEIELLLKVGEYKKGSDRVADVAIDRHDAIREFLRQDTDEHMEFPETLKQLRALAA
jgi:ATP synthase in type III secretion protein N